MKKVVLTAVMGLLALVTPLPAHADGAGYVGTCRIQVQNDAYTGGVLGGPNVWNGMVNLAVAASTPGDVITAASCWIKVSATGTEGKILDASNPLPAPLAVGAGRATFTAAITDTVYLCTHVTTTTGGAEDNCAPLTMTPLCPDLLCGDGGIIGRNGFVDSLTPAGSSYTGGCQWDGTSQVVGSQEVWVGVVSLFAAAATPPDGITDASCWVKVGSGSESKILDGTAAGPVALGADSATFAAAISDTADSDDTMYLCTHVTTSSGGTEDNCTPPVCVDGGPAGNVCLYADV